MTAETDHDMPPMYANERYRAFVHDMQVAGLKPYHSRGRSCYEGPAVTVDDLQDALDRTRVECQWNNTGLGWVVYPK